MLHHVYIGGLEMRRVDDKKEGNPI